MTSFQIKSSIVLTVLVAAYIFYRLTYALYFSPIWIMDENVRNETIDGVEYSIQRLEYKGEVFFSNPTEDGNEYKTDKLIGRTADKLQIYSVENEKDKVVLTGFMFGNMVFEKVDEKK